MEPIYVLIGPQSVFKKKKNQVKYFFNGTDNINFFLLFGHKTVGSKRDKQRNFSLEFSIYIYILVLAIVTIWL